MVNKLLATSYKQGLRWDTSVFQLGLIIHKLLKMLQAVQNISQNYFSDYRPHDGGPRSFLSPPPEYERSVICIGYRPVNDEHKNNPTALESLNVYPWFRHRIVIY